MLSVHNHIKDEIKELTVLFIIIIITIIIIVTSTTVTVVNIILVIITIIITIVISSSVSLSSKCMLSVQKEYIIGPVSYTHLTLPTRRTV